LKKLIGEFFAEQPESVNNMKNLFSAIVQVTIRMFWPGESHKVYIDPRGETKGRRAFFHERRKELAIQYLQLLWAKMKVRMAEAIAEVEKAYKKNPKKNKTPPVAHEARNWKQIFKKQFERLKTMSGKHYAVDYGFGGTWFTNYFSKRTQEGLHPDLPDNRQVKFFDRIAGSSSDDDNDDDDDTPPAAATTHRTPPKKPAAAKKRKIVPTSDDDDETAPAPSRRAPPKKKAAPTAAASTSKQQSKRKSPENDDDDDFESPASRRAPPKKKAAPTASKTSKRKSPENDDDDDFESPAAAQTTKKRRRK
jgi:hypothetical protein